jgi:hypothetical protein
MFLHVGVQKARKLSSSAYKPSDQGILISKIRALARLLFIFGLEAIHTLALADYTVVYSDYTISAGYTLRIGPDLSPSRGHRKKLRSGRLLYVSEQLTAAQWRCDFRTFLIFITLLSAILTHSTILRERFNADCSQRWYDVALVCISLTARQAIDPFTNLCKLSHFSSSNHFRMAKSLWAWLSSDTGSSKTSCLMGF